MTKFWNFEEPEKTGGPRTLRLNGPIDDEAFWGDEVTPKQFREDLEKGDGPLRIEINSPGGNVFAAADIYTMIKGYRNKVSVMITSLAASAASVIAMAGDQISMSPVAMMMIHDPSTMAWGNARDMEKAISVLNEIKESIINAYQAKTGLARDKIAKLMEDETWMNARRARDLGFADSIIGEDDDTESEGVIWNPYSDRATRLAVMNRLNGAIPADAAEGNRGQKEDDEEPDKDPEGAPGAPGEPEEPEKDDPDDPEEPGEPDGPDTEDPEEPEEDDPEGPGDPDEDDKPKPRNVVIGPDGKTADGSVPYAYLMKMLERAK